MLNPIVIRIAKSAILNHFDSTYTFNKNELLQTYPFLGEEAACFVTLNKEHNLRGCIGSLIAHRQLLEDIISNALSAAFNDPRFNPLNFEELSHLTLEVSILTTPQLIEYSDYCDLLQKIEPKLDGLILKHGSYKGTFLPQVWSQLPSANEFLEHLSYKAGATPSIYNSHPTIYRYRVEAIEEKFDAVLPL